MRSHVRRLIGVVALVGVLGACGVQGDDHPRKVASQDVPFDLLASGTQSAPAQADQGVGRTLWFVDNSGFLARGQRQLAMPVTPSDILTALLQGVTDAEANNGLRSNIPSGTKLLGVDGPSEDLVTVNLSGEILTVSREQQRLALAQVVYTVTGLPNVDRVLFEFDGKPTQVPGRGDELTADPLTRDDFIQFDASATTTTVSP
jgi:spore germination protein GerM